MLIMFSIYGYMFYMWSVYYAYQLNPVYARHATVYMLSRMYVLRVMWSMYDMLQIYDSLYTCTSICAINLCMLSVQHTYGTYYQLYCMLHMLSITDTCSALLMHPEKDVNQYSMIVFVSMNDACSSCYQSMIHSLHVIDLLWISIMKTILYCIGTNCH